mmetsp:Transcript_8892/g.26872  ORF Transcript_8892/g.26872 Transcript_8892/m.26872 type:complete len:228 (-) Transcript_8892:201-884(-)
MDSWADSSSSREKPRVTSKSAIRDKSATCRARFFSSLRLLLLNLTKLLSSISSCSRISLASSLSTPSPWRTSSGRDENSDRSSSIIVLEASRSISRVFRLRSFSAALSSSKNRASAIRGGTYTPSSPSAPLPASSSGAVPTALTAPPVLGARSSRLGRKVSGSTPLVAAGADVAARRYLSIWYFILASMGAIFSSTVRRYASLSTRGCPSIERPSNLRAISVPSVAL